jgi:hypothetical protein
MRARFGLLITPSVTVAVCLACSPHEFNDPTGATSKVLFQQTPGASAPVPTPTAIQAAPPTPPAPPASATSTQSRDVVELTSGERIEGRVVQTTTSEVVIEVGGTEVRFGRDRVKAVFYGHR